MEPKISPEIEDFFKKYPFLSKYVYKKRVKTVKISSANHYPNFLKIERRSEKFEEFKIDEIIILLNKEGQKLIEVGIDVSPEKYKNFSWWKRFFKKGIHIYNIESAIRYLKEIGVDENIFFVLSFFKGNLVLYKFKD